jgi:hypothetical protein
MRRAGAAAAGEGMLGWSVGVSADAAELEETVNVFS